MPYYPTWPVFQIDMRDLIKPKEMIELGINEARRFYKGEEFPSQIRVAKYKTGRIKIKCVD